MVRKIGKLKSFEYHDLLEEALQKDADFFAFQDDADGEKVLRLALAED